MDISRLFLQSGCDYKISSSGQKEYAIKHPKLIEIMNLEMKYPGKYFEYLYHLSSTSLDVADVLFCEAKIWYEDITSEWDFFLQKIVPRDPKKVKVAFEVQNGKSRMEMLIDSITINEIYRDALNFFFNTSGEYIIWKSEKSSSNPNDVYILNVPLKNTVQGENVYLYDEFAFKLTPYIYNVMLDYLNKINWITHDYDFLKGGSLGAKKYILKHKYKQRERDAKRKAEPTIDLSSIVSSLIAKGQRYKDVLEYPIYLVYETYHRLVKIDEWNNTMGALYSGNIDTKKNPINWEKINWSSVIKI